LINNLYIYNSSSWNTELNNGVEPVTKNSNKYFKNHLIQKLVATASLYVFE